MTLARTTWLSAQALAVLFGAKADHTAAIAVASETECMPDAKAKFGK